MSQSLVAQHFGGLFFSSDHAIWKKYVAHEKLAGNFFEDHEFSWVYTFGYQGQFFQAKRFSFTYGLQYAYKQNVENYSGMLFCATEIDINTISPIIKKEEKWNLIELPIGARYKILKPSKFQPYISVSFIPLYPLNYEVRQIDTDGKIVKANYQDESIIKRFDASAESGAGLNYKLNQYIFNLHTYIGYLFNLSEVGVGFSVMRKL